MISYAPLWETMKRKGITKYVLKTRHNISPGLLTRLKRNEHISTHTLETLCSILECSISDIVEYIPSKK